MQVSYQIHNLQMFSSILWLSFSLLIVSFEAQKCLILVFLYNFIYLFLAVLGLRCCVGFSLVAESGGYSLVMAHGLLIAVAFLAVKHGRRVHRMWAQ